MKVQPFFSTQIPKEVIPKMAKDYLSGHKRSGIKVGDRVRILRKAETHEQGWENSWEDEMNKAIGKEGRVLRDCSQAGFGIHIKGWRTSSYDYDYPYFVLEKVKK